MKRLAIIATHPIQYYAPWFSVLAREPGLKIKVFYLWDFGVTEKEDQGFQQAIKWDLPLLEGYDFEFVPNTSATPGTHHFFGLRNPELISAVFPFKPDALLLTAYNYASIYKLLFSKKLKDIPIIFRGDSHRLFKRRSLSEILRHFWITTVFHRFAACLYVGEANKAYFRSHGVPDEKLFFAPHAVDNERFMQAADRAYDAALTWRRELGVPEDYIVILFAGKFEEKKRPLDLMQAFIEARLSKAALLFVGSGPCAQRLIDAAQGHDHIYFASFQNQTEMPRALAASDLVVLPSYGRDETWGLIINEAMCLARPVLVSSHVGCGPDLVLPYKNGLIFKAGDVSALRDVLREATSDRERLSLWGEESLKIISAYDYEAATLGLKQALEALG